MPSVFQRMSGWFSKQRELFRYQRALGARDRYVNQVMSEQDRGMAAIDNNPDLTDRQKTQQRLELKEALYEAENGLGTRYSDYRARHMQAIYDPGPRDMDPRGRGIGGMLGRLFSGRATAAAVNQGEQNVGRFEQEYGMTNAERTQLAQIREDQQACAAILVAARDAPNAYDRRREAYVKAVAEDQRSRGVAVPDPPTREWFTEIKGKYKFERQAPAFMMTGSEPETAAYNLRLLRALENKDENGLFRDQATVVEALRGVRDQFANFDVDAIDLNNLSANRALFPDLENLRRSGHSFADVSKMGAGLSRESMQQLFPTQDIRKEWATRHQFIVCAGEAVRGQLIEDANYDRQTLLEYEDPKHVVQRGLNKLTNNPPGGLADRLNLNAFRELYEPMLPNDPRLEPLTPTAERTAEATAEAAANRTAQPQRVEAIDMAALQSDVGISPPAATPTEPTPHEPQRNMGAVAK